VSEVIEQPNFNEMPIAKLREYAKHMRLPLAKTATKLEIIEAIDRKLNGRAAPEFAMSDSKVKPGYAKIRLLSDPMPGAANYPVFVNANGYVCMIPRDVDVIVPQRVVRVLNDAVVRRKKQALVSDNHGREVFTDTEVVVPSYPFQILEMTPGEEPLTILEKGKLKTIGPKRRYRQMFGRWPRPRELTRAIEQKLISLNDDEVLEASVEKLLGTEVEL
jgi:hypothetical protein